MRPELVSIVMPAYNCSAYIRETIESVLGQSYPYWELIVVDDCSSDNTRDIVSEYMKEVTYSIFFIRKEIRRGSSANESYRRGSGKIYRLFRFR